MRLKIIHLISSLRRGGRERQLATIVANTNFYKYPTKIIYFNNSQNSYIEEYGIREHVIRLSSKKFLQRLLELRRLIAEYRPDVIYTWGNLESVCALLLRRSCQFVFINGSIRHGIRAKQFSHYFRTFVLHLSPYIVANSNAGLMANNLKRGFVLYNGIDSKFLTPLPNRTSKRTELTHCPESTIIFISVANLVPYKDYHTVLKALALLKNGHPDFHYLVLGEGPVRKEIEALIKSSGLENNVTIIGNVENVHEFLKISDIFIHSSKGEGCSNAILEAMAAGLPIVASNTGGTPEIIDKEYGFLFEYGDFMELKALIKTFFQNPDLGEKLGKSSLEQVKMRFGINIMMKNYYQILDNIIGG